MLLVTSVASAEIPIDIGANAKRNDTGAFGWKEWPIDDESNAAHLKTNNLQLTILPEGVDKLHSVLSKTELAVDAKLACDAVFVRSQSGAGIKIQISGMSPGMHTITTIHNLVWEAESISNLRVSSGGETALVTPSHGIKHDDDSGYAHLEILVPENGKLEVKIEANEAADEGYIVLNGIILDGHDPNKQALKPVPTDRNEHIDGDEGSVSLSWKPSAAKSHRIYLASAEAYEEAIAALRPIQPDEALIVGETQEPNIDVNVVPHDSLKRYAWRVDELHSNGQVVPGRIWTFRVRHLAFPGAEGYGRFALGGRGGAVYIVSNLNDSGPGSLREAIEANEPRTIVFEVGGLISLKSRILIRNPYITIAGQTAPGKGICVRNYNIGGFGSHDIIMRFLRLRLGDLANRSMDGTGLASCDCSIFDHLSVSWALDETISTRGAGNVTIQKSIVSEALLNHPRYSGGYAGSIGGDIISLHHNLLAHNAGRNWSLAGALDKAGRHQGRLDIRNNVVYNWIKRTNDGGAMLVQIVNNYYKPGPASKVFHILDPERNHHFGPQDYYVSGNIMEGHVSADDDWGGIVEPKNEELAEFVYRNPFFESYVETHSAEEAFVRVLADVGCNIPQLDDHDQRIIRETREGTSTFVGSLTKTPGVINSQEDSGGWEEYPEVYRPQGWDTDRDGIPNAWETACGLNPNDPSDSRIDSNRNGYTALEEYLAWLVMEKS